jgi:tetratricopeptide (TPR) repeat protein
LRLLIDDERGFQGLQMAYPQTLIKNLQAGKVIPFVGAGVSRSVIAKDGKPLFPTWRQLLYDAADRLKAEGKETYGALVRNLVDIDQPDYLKAAEYAKTKLGAIWFEFLREQFDHQRAVVADDSLSLPRKTWMLGSKLVVTTNYDRILRWTCPSQDDVREWPIEAPAEQALALKGEITQPIIWYLHGSIANSAQIILTPDGYERLYPSTQISNLYTSALTTLNTLLTTHSFLFIGFSLTDETFGLQLRAVCDSFAGAVGPHYALLHKDSIEAVRRMNYRNVDTIAYEEHGEPLLRMLDELSCEAQAHTKLVSGPLFTSLEQVEPVRKQSSIKVTEASTTRSQEDFDDTCDTPPKTDLWVGRVAELTLLDDPNAKVVAITGIGGQGKSTLAAKYLRSHRSNYSFWDWRDCKEEGNTFQTQLIRLIERVTRGHKLANDLVDHAFDSTIKLFFNVIQPINGLFVFDNIDHYVDARNSRAVAGMNEFIQAAINSAGHSRIILTARPRLNYEDTAFMQIELRGLSLNDTGELFAARGVRPQESQLREVHELTQGHPLWVGLVAAQVRKTSTTLADLIRRMRAGRDAGEPEAMLQELWTNLTRKQHTLLRYLAELVRPETEAHLQDFVSGDLSAAQFQLTLKQLKALDLVVVKSPTKGPDTIELHPLIRQFVHRQFSPAERNPFINAILLVVEKALGSEHLGVALYVPYAKLLAWIDRIQLLTNSRDFGRALSVLSEAQRSLIISGFYEELIRLSTKILDELDFSDLRITDSTHFDDVVKVLVDVLGESGRYDEAIEYINKFEGTVAGETPRYVCLCQMRAYLYWNKQEYDLAKEWGKRGVVSKTQHNLDTRYDCGHELALAQRDSGELEPALAFFLGGVPIADVANPLSIDVKRGGHFYGNIGRILFCKGDLEAAKSCFIKSVWILQREKDSRVPFNRGWAAFWLGELFRSIGENRFAYICFRQAYYKWRDSGPKRAEQAEAAAKALEPHADRDLVDAEDWFIERQFINWAENQRQFPDWL